MSKKNNKKKANYISRGKLEHALNIKNNRKDEETESVQETKKEDVKKESVEVKANVNNKPANNKSSKKKYKKGYINSEKLNLDDRVTVEDIIMEETKKDLGEITDKDLVIDNDLEKRRYRAMDAFKYNKVLTTLYTMDCDENDEKVIDNILELVMHCKDKDRKKCVSIVKKFNSSDKSKEDLAKTLAQLCAVCKTDIQTIMDKINPPKESLKDKTVVETVEAEIVENNEEDLKEAVEPTKEELMQDVEMEAKMDIKTNKENTSIDKSNNTKDFIDVKNKVNKSAKEIVNDAYKAALREFQINASTGDDFSLLRRMTVNGDNVYDAMKEIGINDCDFDGMAIALISGRLHYILSTRELLVYSNKYKNKDCCKNFINLFVSKCKMEFPTDKKPEFEKVVIVG